jgi:hypothetical protein
MRVIGQPPRLPVRARAQCDLVLQGSPLAADKVGPDVAQQSCHRRIVGRDQCGEAADAFGAGTVS